MRLCLKLSEHEDFNHIIDRPTQPTEADLASDDALDNWMLRNVATMHHISSTCRQDTKWS